MPQTSLETAVTDDLDPTVPHGEEGPSGDREVQNHGDCENEPVSPTAFPSAPPNPCSTRVWTGSGENSDTTLCHTVPKRPSKKRSPTIGSPSRGCSTTSSHTPSKRPLQPSPRSPTHRRRQSSGLIVRGSTYYLRLRVPRSLAAVIGKTHVVKSLGTGYRADAVRQSTAQVPLILAKLSQLISLS